MIYNVCSVFTSSYWLVELFYELGSVHSFVAEATSNIAITLCGKRIFYFDFVIYNRTVKTDPVPILEVLTDCAGEGSFTCLLTSFLRDEHKCYGHEVKAVRIICTVDLPWPLIGAILKGTLQVKTHGGLKLVPA